MPTYFHWNPCKIAGASSRRIPQEVLPGHHSAVALIPQSTCTERCFFLWPTESQQARRLGRPKEMVVCFLLVTDPLLLWLATYTSCSHALIVLCLRIVTEKPCVIPVLITRSSSSRSWSCLLKISALLYSWFGSNSYSACSFSVRIM